MQQYQLKSSVHEIKNVHLRYVSLEDTQIRTVWTVAAKPDREIREQLRTGFRQAHGNIQCYTRIIIITTSVAEPKKYFFTPCCCCSVAQSCQTLRDSMDYTKPGFPVHHHLQELAQTQVHWVSDAIQPSQPLPPSNSMLLIKLYLWASVSSI